MNEERERRLARIYDAIFDLEDQACAQYLDSACEGDPILKAEVVSLLGLNCRTAAADVSFTGLAQRSVGQCERLDPPIAFARYQLIEKLGAGGMGQVWLAEHALENGSIRREAVKFISGSAMFGESERFAGEIASHMELKHPYIAPLYGDGVLEDGRPFFTMAYIEGGKPITAFCETSRLSIRERLRLFLKVCEAVQYAHGCGVVHRDLKPENILVDSNGVPQLLDFGIATEVAESPDQKIVLQPMTPAYSAPELWDGCPATPCSDVWSLGIVLFQLLAGVHPFLQKGETARELENAVKARDAVKPSNYRRRNGETRREDWDDLDALCRRTLRTNPKDRYQTAR